MSDRGFRRDSPRVASMLCVVCYTLNFDGVERTRYLVYLVRVSHDEHRGLGLCSRDECDEPQWNFQVDAVYRPTFLTVFFFFVLKTSKMPQGHAPSCACPCCR